MAKRRESPARALVLAAGMAAAGSAVAADAGPARDYGTVAYAEIAGPIDRMRDRYLRRVIEDARAAGADTLLVRIDTDGGQVHYAREMFKRVLDLDNDGIRAIAFVDFRAISAGALIAYAHHEIYMAETASIGDIGVVYRTPDGGMAYAPEKAETVVRTLLAQAAEQRGWSRGLLLKMTAHKQVLYRVTHADGRVVYVIEDDLPEFLARHPGIDRDDDRQVIVYRGADRLITLTGREAARLSMANATVANLEAMQARLVGAAGDMLDLSPEVTETVAWSLARFAPFLAGLAMLFLLFELKTPGVGIWAALSALCGTGFLVAQFSLDLVQHWELLLIAIGLGLVIAEGLTMAGGGLLAALGAATAFAGLLLASLPNEFDFDLDDPVFLDALGDAALGSVAAVAVVLVGFVLGALLLPRSGRVLRIAMAGAVTATSAAGSGTRSDLVGRAGEAREALRPSGLIEVDGETMSARVQQGAFVAGGDPVEVVGVEFGEIVVRPRRGAAAVERRDGR